ncbi:glycosyltransferase family 4 protein [Aliidiomarina maris]|uniref:Glycosyltransferase involved in cell wall biosynthesis n=1 Tax=Aliidiomarina maris TaxID=531312 RepID=A0A327XAB4_9GAMM|nr:glycosyltransferase family 4 protein [Aliidiomarina maris]MCL5050185.1 glycosyltransferase family 4 protein [Bacillota bacterium]RAK00607.1 glycosyltransferase involved in cell wall biosynthesis [Aliidiomarina maris]RUO27381.1 hypothetical protein CWE07_05415 [Aliidiomarina maris]
MRIVHVLLTKRFAGTERHVVDLVSEQAKTHDVHVILHAKGYGSRVDAVARRFPTNVTLHKVGRPIRQWTFAQVRHVIGKINPDVVHCHLKAACKSVKGLRNVARIATLHIDYDAAQHAHMDALICLTPQQQVRAQAVSQAKLVHIDNWVTGEPANSADAEAIRRQHGFDKDAFIIGTVGRIEASKRHRWLIETLQPLLSDAVKLVIIGEGRLRAELEQAYPEVYFPGYSDTPKAWLKSFDVFVNVADFEPFGLVFLEAAQAGTDIVATQTEGASHLSQLLGFEVVPIDNPEAFRQAISSLLDAKQKTRSYDLTGFDLAGQSAKVEQVYSACLQE